MFADPRLGESQVIRTNLSSIVLSITSFVNHLTQKSVVLFMHADLKFRLKAHSFSPYLELPLVYHTAVQERRAGIERKQDCLQGKKPINASIKVPLCCNERL